MVGSIERDGERIAHLDCVRSLQDAGSTNEATRKRARRHGTRHRVRTPASRARRAALTALCSLAVALLGIAGDRNAPSGARADVVFQRPFEGDYSVSADVLIPRAERNQGWYGGRIALTGFYSPQDEPVFIILGLRRPSGDWPRLIPTVTYRLVGKNPVTVDAGPVDDGEHQLRLIVGGGRLSAGVDGVTVLSLNERALFAPARRVEFDAGFVVFTAGDEARGTIRNVVFRGSDGVEQPLRSGCGFHEEGISVAVDGDNYVATGTLKKDAPAEFYALAPGKCSWIP